MIHETAFIHASATVLGNVSLGALSSVWPGAVLRGDTDRIEVGDESNVQDGAVLHCDENIPCIIGKRVTIGHGAVVHGAIVEDGALIGIGAVVLNNARIGAGSLVAAGAVVAEGAVIPPHSLVLGVPARVKGPLSDAQRARVAHGYEAYVQLAATHRAGRVQQHR
ncbi:gamma carbonic anhydrase family protein [Gemmatimonadota bacterium]|jgi:carbonic anhydrase/acetyltransferase-like protein (isoleucine patch superfamily)|nr:gamma carbonic anhydrase family protein [Gemmatimonadota bacterium]